MATAWEALATLQDALRERDTYRAEVVSLRASLEAVAEKYANTRDIRQTTEELLDASYSRTRALDS